MMLRCRDIELSLDSVAVMGVLNVTPDSFSDGGLWLDPDAAIAHGVAMVAEGAAIVDVGGESTRPGASPVPEEEELRRVLPVIERLAAEIPAPISIDTRHAATARAALEAGASIVNDTAGEATSPDMDRLIASSDCGVIAMHSRGSPGTMLTMTAYSDVVRDVTGFLLERAERLESLGVKHDSIALDPGFGFAKNAEQNLELLARLDEVTRFDYPVVAGTSRKSFIGKVLDVETGDRAEGTLATVVWAVAKGARIVRVHDVRAAVRAMRMTEAVQGASPHEGRP
ncbi:MAG: dihydropteroate synthase [Actinomycetota bacterium]|nr:dihydropteroate synthase [Actinomycetota bacterium]